METCSRTIHGLPLLRPGEDPDEIVLGCLGKAAEYYDVDIYGFGFASTHVHLLHSAEHGLQMSRFQGHFNGNVAREMGRLHSHPEKLWGRRYRPMAVSDDRESQRARLKYVLSQAVKDGLVARVLDWPGPNAAKALLDDSPLVGYWFDRTKEYYARRKRIQFEKYDFATRYEIGLKRMPAYLNDSPEEYRGMIAELIEEIEQEAAAKRGGRSVVGVEAILRQDPCTPIVAGKKGKKSPAPMLFYSKRPELREGMASDYQDFLDEYLLGSARMVEAAERGYHLDPRLCLPTGSQPPMLADTILQLSGFNPETAFPTRSFPRAWPYVGGELPPPPTSPPTRKLALLQVDDHWEVVGRGEIPTVHVPRLDLDRFVKPSVKQPISIYPIPAQEIRHLPEPARAPP